MVLQVCNLGAERDHFAGEAVSLGGALLQFFGELLGGVHDLVRLLGSLLVSFFIELLGLTLSNHQRDGNGLPLGLLCWFRRRRQGLLTANQS